MITFISEEGDVYACIWRMGASSLAVKGLLWMPSEWTDHCIQRIKSCQRGTGKSVLIEKDPDAGKDWGQKRRGQQMMGWLDQITKLPMLSSSGDSERMGSLICCSPWVHKESDTTWWLNNREETSLMVQCLRLYLPMQWVQVSSLVGVKSFQIALRKMLLLFRLAVCIGADRVWACFPAALPDPSHVLSAAYLHSLSFYITFVVHKTWNILKACMYTLHSGN